MPMNSATYSVAGSSKTCSGRADLLEAAGPHDRDAVGEGERLALVVGDEDGAEPQTGVQLVELGPHLVAQPGVEVAQRLVEEHDVGAGDEAPGERDALLLAAAQLRRVAVEQRASSRPARPSPRPSPSCRALLILRAFSG